MQELHLSLRAVAVVVEISQVAQVAVVVAQVDFYYQA
jgi:hypothetical protein